MPSTEPAAPTPRDALAPEDRLVLLLARASLPPHLESEAKALAQGPLRWNLVVELAATHGVFPLVHRNLRALPPGVVPPEAQARLEALQKVNALRATLLMEELGRVLALLSAHEVPAIPLKGPALSERLLGDARLRVFGDLDVLVPQALVPMAIHVLTGSDYRLEFSAPFLERLLPSYGIERPLLKDVGAIPYEVDLHWAILLPARWDQDAIRDLWAEASPSRFLATDCYALSPEWEFLYLCAHAALHRWEGVKWLLDIDHLCAAGTSGSPPDWGRLRAKVERLGWGAVVTGTLSRCHALLGTEVPDPLRALADGARSSAGARRFGPLQDIRPRLVRGARARLHFWLAFLFVPTAADGRFLRLPSWLGLLYYLVRPLRLAVESAREVLRS